MATDKNKSKPQRHKQENMVGSKNRQRGAFLMARWVLLMLILVGMLVIPIWLKRSNDDKQNERVKAEALAESGPTPAPAATTSAALPVAAVAPPPPRPIAYGLTFAQGAAGADTPLETSHLTCHGEPKPSDRPHKDSCNPYQGDTSCRVVLPVLCMKAGGQGELGADSASNWMAGTLGATAPVMGALLDSQESGSARCEKELGAGWQMADFHAGGGWSMRGKTSISLAARSYTRYWVAVTDQPGNCWNSAP